MAIYVVAHDRVFPEIYSVEAETEEEALQLHHECKSKKERPKPGAPGLCWKINQRILKRMDVAG